MRVRHAFAAPFVLTAALAHADPPKAKKGQPVYQDGEACYTYARKEVQCPPNLILQDAPDLGDGGYSYDPSTFQCMKVPEVHCSGTHHTCNPPAAMPAPCPADMLPKLAKGVKPTRRKGKRCYYGKVKVVCP